MAADRRLGALLRQLSASPDSPAPASAHHATVTPWDWQPQDWARLEAERRPIFREERLAQIDRKQFLEDGYALLDDFMTPYSRREWTAALQQGQRTRDAMIREDWRESIDWAALSRLSPPTARPTAAQVAEAEGCMQEPPGDESCGTKTLKNNGLFVDHFSAVHLPFLMDVLTHPQMLQLQRSLLGSPNVLLDHNSLLNRKGGYEGGGWHSHSMNSKNWSPMDEYDDGTPTTPGLYDQQPVRTPATMCCWSSILSLAPCGLFSLQWCCIMSHCRTLYSTWCIRKVSHQRMMEV